ncbi:MAG: hypothetical protein K2K60_06745 [Clostridia bacterium]|nr:hypothetical protein [Clostridia bacterium]
MKVILSKKGFDSSNSTNPILITNNELLFLPIPSSNKTDKRYSEIFIDNEVSLLDYCREMGINYVIIGGNKVLIDGETNCHLDPQLLDYFGYADFKGSFGQESSPQGHLKNNNVQVGDLFLFYGWHKDLKDNIHKDGKHTIFGYLQIGEIIKVNELTPEYRQEIIKKYPWLKHHPHWYSKETNNTIYIAKEHFAFDTSLKGYGMFKYGPELDLSANDMGKRTCWRIPALKGLKASYKGVNGKEEFDELGQYIIFPRCQELVIDSPQAEQWAINLIKQYVKR